MDYTDNPCASRTQRSRDVLQNRLSGEKSPYLLQHANDPVDWYPWGDEAFERAKRDDKPVFLSIGYSACHWCHVMAKESFQDQKVADIINEGFVAVKVDREERLDVDMIYMQACQMLTGAGGWPLTVITDPNAKPFFAATYIPKTGRFGASGLMELLPLISSMWKNDRKKLMDTAEQVVLGLKTISSGQPGNSAGEKEIRAGYSSLEGRFDWINGGFGSAPKFPSPHNLLFLLRCWRRWRDEAALEMAETTLQAMRAGGIYDHLGFGFHRYSTTADWSVPHFEKMIYDQALLAISYAEGFAATGKEEYAKTACEILDYTIREMRSLNGGFYSAQDADSEGEEGRYYLWEYDELKAALQEDHNEKAGLFDIFTRAFDVRREGNFHEVGMQPSRRNILRLSASMRDVAVSMGIEEDIFIKRLEEARRRLISVREKRAKPFCDSKILTDCNGLMIAALSIAARVLNREDYVLSAKSCADFILTSMQRDEGGLLHRYSQGEAGIEANLDDYAFLIWGLLELFETSFVPHYLKAAIRLDSYMLEHFWDRESEGLYFTPDTAQVLIVRRKEGHDGSIPSGNSVAMANLIRLGRMTGDPQLLSMASGISKAFYSQMQRAPAAFTHMLSSACLGIDPSQEIVIKGQRGHPVVEAMLSAVRSGFNPDRVVILIEPSSRGEIEELAPFTIDLAHGQCEATAYICSGGRCQLPVCDRESLLKLLGNIAG